MSGSGDPLHLSLPHVLARRQIEAEAGGEWVCPVCLRDMPRVGTPRGQKPHPRRRSQAHIYPSFHAKRLQCDWFYACHSCNGAQGPHPLPRWARFLVARGDERGPRVVRILEVLAQHGIVAAEELPPYPPANGRGHPHSTDTTGLRAEAAAPRPGGDDLPPGISPEVAG